MTAQVLFFDVFSEKDPHLNAVEGPSVNIMNKMSKHLKTELVFRAEILITHITLNIYFLPLQNNCFYLVLILNLRSKNSQKQPLEVFSCEFCEISKNTFFTEHLWMTASPQHISPPTR